MIISPVIGFGSSPSGGLIFSTTETDTGWIWKDNRPIYMCTYTLSTTSTSGVSLGVISSLREVIWMIGVVYSDSNKNYRSLDSPAANTSNYIRVSILDGTITASSTVSGNKTFTATVFFTKI